MAKLTLDEIERIQALLANNTTAWALLSLIFRNQGSYSTYLLSQDTETKLQQKMPRPRITEARIQLETHGISVAKSCGLHFSMSPRIYDAYSMIFRGIALLQDELDNQKVAQAEKIQKKRDTHAKS